MPGNVHCCVKGCNVLRFPKRDGIELFEVPTSMKTRTEWLKATGKDSDWIPPSKPYICNKHFKDGRPTIENPYPIPYVVPVGTAPKKVRLCKLCNLQLPSSQALWNHKKKSHPTEMKGRIARKKCGICMKLFTSQMEICKHVTRVHSIPTVIRDLELPTFALFEIWKKNAEQNGRCHFVRRKDKKSSRIYYYCDLFGQYPQGKPTGKSRNIAFKRSEFHCSAFITTKTTKTGTVYIQYCLNHYGHDLVDPKSTEKVDGSKAVDKAELDVTETYKAISIDSMPEKVDESVKISKAVDKAELDLTGTSYPAISIDSTPESMPLIKSEIVVDSISINPRRETEHLSTTWSEMLRSVDLDDETWMKINGKLKEILHLCKGSETTLEYVPTEKKRKRKRS